MSRLIFVTPDEGWEMCAHSQFRETYPAKPLPQQIGFWFGAPVIIMRHGDPAEWDRSMRASNTQAGEWWGMN